MPDSFAVLFVCLGNICRSPAAEGVFRELVARAGLADRITVDSAGTGAWHAGDPPDPRMIAAAAERGYRLDDQRARPLSEDDCRTFDLIVAMDRSNLRHLEQFCPDHGRLRLLMEFTPGHGTNEVPDPYFGGHQGFERVVAMVEEALQGLLEHVRGELEG